MSIDPYIQNSDVAFIFENILMQDFWTNALLS